MARMKNWFSVVLVLLVLFSGGAGVSVAATGQAQGTGQPAAQQPQDEFVPVKSLPQQEQLPAAPLLIGAYAFVWAVLLVYVWSIWRRLTKVEREMHELAGRIADRPATRR